MLFDIRRSLIQYLSLAVAGAVMILGFQARADVRLPAIFSDHMVLQAGAEAPVWGWAAPGESVSVAINGATAKTTAGQDGKWQVKLGKLAAGGPHTLEIAGKNNLVIKDVLIGEVWLGSGQSNMAMTVNRAKDFEQEQAAANYPQIRMFTESSPAAEKAQAECHGEWAVCSPDTVARFSATAYFFGRELHKELGVPVGLINSSVGGTPIESWISPEAQSASAELKAFFNAFKATESKVDAAAAKAKYERDLTAWQAATKTAKAEGKPLPKKPQDPVVVQKRKGNVGGLFNGKIAPLIPYAIRGALWYQGEANSTPGKAEFYQYQLPLLIKDWRTRWGYEFPVAWVQLPNFGGPGRDWPTVREAMLKSLAVPKTGMAITIDIGEEKDIHPKNKQDVGKRLALWALGEVYDKPVPTSGPLPAGHERRGNAIAVRFSHVHGGLVAKGGELQGFEIAGKDGNWKPASARIDGDAIIVSAPEIPEPAAVRYAWSNFPTCNLYNIAGLPASPFRTKSGE
jgi:sialate O-acetylesterase